MANQIFVNPYPFAGKDNTEASQIISGSIALCGSAVTTGEPITWGNMVTGIQYNEKNFMGNGATLNTGSALVTTFSASAGTVTATAANNFSPGQKVTFLGNTSVLGLLLNGTTATVVTANSTTFTFLSGATGTGTSEVGMAVNITQGYVFPDSRPQANLSSSITAVSASGGIITVTAANSFLPGANVTFTTGTGALLVALLASSQNTTLGGYSVIQSTGTAFTIASALTGATGTGTCVGFNDPQPWAVDLYGVGGTGYVYTYNEQYGTLFVQQGGASTSVPLANLGAGAYPAGVLGDIVKFNAYFSKG